ncbi:MAG: methionine synthase, partial [Treponema sp.]|nr:methionine synthase [Treponema sp.]
ILDKVLNDGLPELRGVVGIFPAFADGDDIVVETLATKEKRRFCFLRNQQKKVSDPNPCLADFLAPANDRLGLFALSAGWGIEESAAAFRRNRDDYGALLLETLANVLTEAFAEEVHSRIRYEWWGYTADPADLSGIRPAFGYPCCPDHEDKRLAFELLDAERHSGLRLTESAMVIPAASICGMFFANRESGYFGIGSVGRDQLEDWAARKNIPTEEAARRLGTIFSR